MASEARRRRREEGGGGGNSSSGVRAKAPGVDELNGEDVGRALGQWGGKHGGRIEEKSIWEAG